MTTTDINKKIEQLESTVIAYIRDIVGEVETIQLQDSDERKLIQKFYELHILLEKFPYRKSELMQKAGYSHIFTGNLETLAGHIKEMTALKTKVSEKVSQMAKAIKSGEYNLNNPK